MNLYVPFVADVAAGVELPGDAVFFDGFAFHYELAGPIDRELESAV